MRLFGGANARARDRVIDHVLCLRSSISPIFEGGGVRIVASEGEPQTLLAVCSPAPETGVEEERGSCYSIAMASAPQFLPARSTSEPHPPSPVENAVAVSLGAVPQAMAVAPYAVAGVRRRRLGDCDPRQQRRKVQGFGVDLHLWEKPLAEVVPILAVDTAAPCPTVPSLSTWLTWLTSPTLATWPTLRVPMHHSLHHQATHSHLFDMLLHLARIGHILHIHLYPREWALYVSTDDMDGQAERREGSITRATHLNHLPHLPLQGPVPVVSLSPSSVAAYMDGGHRWLSFPPR